MKELVTIVESVSENILLYDEVFDDKMMYTIRTSWNGEMRKEKRE